MTKIYRADRNLNGYKTQIAFALSLTSLSVSAIAAFCPTSQMSILAISGLNAVAHYATQELIAQRVAPLNANDQHFLSIISQAANAGEGMNDAQRGLVRQAMENAVNAVVNIPDNIKSLVRQAVRQPGQHAEGQAPARA